MKFSLFVFLVFILFLSACTQPGIIPPKDIVPTNDIIVEDFATLAQDPYVSLAYPVCMTSANCDSSFIERTCLKCPSGMFVYSKGCQSPPGIATGDATQGLCIQSHMLGTGYNAYHTGTCIPETAFCLVNFAGQQVPTIHSLKSIRALPLWKAALFTKAGITEQYFNDHFSVSSADATPDGIEFLVTYQFTINWATIVDMNGGFLNDWNTGNAFDDAQIMNSFKIKFNHSIPSILSKSAIEKKLQQECSPKIKIETPPFPNNLRITDDGNIVLDVHAEINQNANQCKFARIDLENGNILSCQDTPCFIT